MERAERDRLQRYMVRLADGDRDAFHAVFVIMWPVVRRFAERALNGAPAAEDVAQVALLRVFARAAEFDREGDALPWILGIAAYECRTARQQARRRREDVGGLKACASLPAIGDSPEAAVIAYDLECAALEILGTLHPSDADTVRALVGGERPAVNGATFRKRVQRALSRLREQYKAKYGT